MTPNKIVMDELRRQAVCTAPLCLILTGVLILFGRDPARVALSAAAGYLYTLFNFYMIGRSSAYAAQQTDPARATKIVMNGFAQRYILSALYLVFVFLSGIFDVVAGVMPLLFPKVILLIFHIVQKKGGK